MEIPGGLALVGVLWVVELARRRRARLRRAQYQRIADALADLRSRKSAEAALDAEGWA